MRFERVRKWRILQSETKERKAQQTETEGVELAFA